MGRTAVGPVKLVSFVQMPGSPGTLVGVSRDADGGADAVMRSVVEGRLLHTEREAKRRLLKLVGLQERSWGKGGRGWATTTVAMLEAELALLDVEHDLLSALLTEGGAA